MASQQGSWSESEWRRLNQGRPKGNGLDDQLGQIAFDQAAKHFADRLGFKVDKPFREIHELFTSEERPRIHVELISTRSSLQYVCLALKIEESLIRALVLRDDTKELREALRSDVHRSRPREYLQQIQSEYCAETFKAYRRTLLPVGSKQTDVRCGWS